MSFHFVDAKLGQEGRMGESRTTADASSAIGQPYLQYIDMPPLVALEALANTSRELLRDTAELPDSEQGLLDVLAEYRYAVYAFLSISGGL